MHNVRLINKINLIWNETNYFCSVKNNDEIIKRIVNLKTDIIFLEEKVKKMESTIKWKDDCIDYLEKKICELELKEK
jgi:hypothetical protein